MEVDWRAFNLPIHRIIWNQQQYLVSVNSPMLLGSRPDEAEQLARDFPLCRYSSDYLC
jgi:hypothetical protein